MITALSELLADILAAGGPSVQPARVRWPMHLALHQSYIEASRLGRLDVFEPVLRFAPCASVGRSAVGADAALEQLLQSGILRAEGRLRGATLVSNQVGLVAHRRRLMMMDPVRVRQLQRAGERWAAFSATAMKNRSTAARSSASTV